MWAAKVSTSSKTSLGRNSSYRRPIATRCVSVAGASGPAANLRLAKPACHRKAAGNEANDRDGNDRPLKRSRMRDAQNVRAELQCEDGEDCKSRPSGKEVHGKDPPQRITQRSHCGNDGGERKWRMPIFFFSISYRDLPETLEIPPSPSFLAIAASRPAPTVEPSAAEITYPGTPSG